ncbi:MAG TPA: SdrD B-like domain-containing protein, partial [Tepidisphaeraceae bacterium]
MAAVSEFFPQPLTAPAGQANVAAATMPRRVFMLGNSMTDGVGYAGFTQLLARDSSPLSFGRQTGSGFPQAYNYYLTNGGVFSGIDPQRPGVSNPWGNYANAAAYGWDAVTLQPQERRLHTDVQPSSTGPREEADVPMSVGFLKAFAAASPGVQGLVYSRSMRRTDVTSAMQPTGKAFDYSAEWVKTYVDSGTGRNGNYFTRSFAQQFMPALRSAQAAAPETASLPLARVVPVGEAMYNIDQMIKAGRFAGTGIDSILPFYADQSHPTFDLGSYVIGLSFYSSITGTDPRGVAPTSGYLNSTSLLNNPQVQSLIQEAVHGAMTSSHYAGYTTPLGEAPPVDPPPQTGGIAAVVFNDKNRSASLDSADTAMSGVKVYLDFDNDAVHDAGEASAITDSAGVASFSRLAPGEYSVRAIKPSGTDTTVAPLSAVTVVANDTTSVRFGYAAAVTPPEGDAVTLPAENAALAGGTYKTTSYGGFNGTGFADFGGINSSATFTISRTSAGNVKLDARY